MDTYTYGALTVPWLSPIRPTGFSVTFPGGRYCRFGQAPGPVVQLYPCWGARSSTVGSVARVGRVAGLNTDAPGLVMQLRLLASTSAEASCWIDRVKFARWTIVLPLLMTTSCSSGAKPAGQFVKAASVAALRAAGHHHLADATAAAMSCSAPIRS